MRVSGRLAIDRWRRAHRNPKKFGTPDPDTSIQERVDLHRALDGLSARQREVVILRFMADLPEGVVAEALGCSLSTVKTHAARGLAALRTILDIDEEAQR